MAASSSTVPVMISYVGIAVASASVVNVVPPVSTLRLVSTPATFNSYVFLDLETTGIITTEDPTCRITELSMWGIEREQFLNCNGNKMPRITNRLNMCVDPSKEIHPMAATKSKLDNLNLSHQSPFDEDVANTVLSFLNRLKKPMCMIAHYGFKFDFPILKSEIANVGKVLLMQFILY
jgi:DNA polymerase III epsilon subunit-like protein